jgi:hypothetical protein
MVGMSGWYSAKAAGLQGGMWRANKEKRPSAFDVMAKLSHNFTTRLNLNTGMSNEILPGRP